jgi:signal transduction histidine kinase
MPHIFERFYRGQQVAQLGVPGTGLGLGIVKEIMDLHGGRVEAASELGKGSLFRVWLAAVEDGA